MQGHPVLLRLALRNLMENALSHTPSGTCVEVQLDPECGWIQVCDDAVEPITAHSAQLREPSASFSLGMGIGHRVVEKVAEIHGARFESAVAPPSFNRCYRIDFLVTSQTDS